MSVAAGVGMKTTRQEQESKKKKETKTNAVVVPHSSSPQAISIITVVQLASPPSLSFALLCLSVSVTLVQHAGCLLSGSQLGKAHRVVVGEDGDGKEKGTKESHPFFTWQTASQCALSPHRKAKATTHVRKSQNKRKVVWWIAQNQTQLVVLT